METRLSRLPNLDSEYIFRLKPRHILHNLHTISVPSKPFFLSSNLEQIQLSKIQRTH